MGSLVFGSIAIALAIWGLWQNEITSRQRGALIDEVFRGDDWRQKRELYETVSYERHLFYRMTFRNPAKLYHPSLAEVLA